MSMHNQTVKESLKHQERLDRMHPNCGPDCVQCGFMCKRGIAVDVEYASRLALMLECMLVDSHGHWNEAAKILDEYKAEWEKVNPSPPTFIGEPIPQDRRDRLMDAVAKREEKS